DHDGTLRGGVADVLEQIKALAHSRKPGEWIVASVLLLRPGQSAGPQGGGGGFAGGFGAGPPEPPLSLAELDAAAPDNPVLIGGGYFPSQANSRAIELLEAKYPGIPGILKGKDGKPTGTIEIT